MEKTTNEIVTLKKKIRLQKWKQQIEEQKSSGLSVQEWCIQNGINLKTYYYHLRRVREEFFKSSQSERIQVENDTVRAVVPILAAPSGGNISIEKNGLNITFQENISADIVIAEADKLS